MSYVLDTSALIGAWVRKYPEEIFPSLWENLHRLGKAAKLCVPQEVHFELKRRDDGLYKWVEARASDLVAPTTRALTIAARAVLADHPKLTMSGTGRGHADPFVIAEGKMRNFRIVTEEHGGTKRSPRIPYVCSELGVTSIEMLDLIRSERWTFR